VVGLGNPGPRYRDTRHNAGYRVVDRFARELNATLDAVRFSGRFGWARLEVHRRALEVALLEPDTFMNRSGFSVAAALSQLSIPDPSRDLLVVYDDLDLPFGRVRLRASGGAGGHRGMADILDRLGTREVPRLRFGIGRPPEDQDPVDYVLSPFSSSETQGLEAAVTAAALAVRSALCDGVVEAMSRVNRVSESQTSESESSRSKSSQGEKGLPRAVEAGGEQSGDTEQNQE
jgi:PTH1 family peptidyl-tRNA hydrolase